MGGEEKGESKRLIGRLVCTILSNLLATNLNEWLESYKSPSLCVCHPISFLSIQSWEHSLKGKQTVCRIKGTGCVATGSSKINKKCRNLK
jgi:hypothetical protein